jgi:pentatricopeptide repeat protein
MERTTDQVADIYLLSALLYVCAKAKQISQAERIFWKEIPRRGLSYTIATTNSLMYMYAKLNRYAYALKICGIYLEQCPHLIILPHITIIRADDALKVYELTKSLGIKCTVVTFGVLIKVSLFFLSL